MPAQHVKTCPVKSAQVLSSVKLVFQRYDLFFSSVSCSPSFAVLPSGHGRTGFQPSFILWSRGSWGSNGVTAISCGASHQIWLQCSMAPSLTSEVCQQGNRISSADLKNCFDETRQPSKVTWQEKKDDSRCSFLLSEGMSKETESCLFFFNLLPPLSTSGICFSSALGIKASLARPFHWKSREIMKSRSVKGKWSSSVQKDD